MLECQIWGRRAGGATTRPLPCVNGHGHAQRTPLSKEEILAAIDDSWRAFKGSLEPLTAAEMAAAGTCGDRSVKDVLSHIASAEAALTRTLLDNGAQADVAGNGAPRRDLSVAQVLTELDETHRALRDALLDASQLYFAWGTPVRERIDRATALHYYGHSAQILALAARKTGGRTGPRRRPVAREPDLLR